MKRFLFTAASCAMLAATSVPAYAQSIDYQTMEELFGEPVTTSATGKPQRMSEAPATMEILTQEDIRRSGAVNLPEVLREVNGVNVVQRTEEQYDVSIRGYNQPLSQRLLVLVNGRQVYLDQYGYTNWNSIPVQLEEIQQIEVVKGPNTALFGFNAVNGVINIVTHNPLYNDESSAGVTLGTGDYRKAHYVQSFKVNDKIATRVSAGVKRSNDFNNSDNSATTTGLTKTDPESESLNIDTMFQVTEKSQLRLELSGNSNESDEVYFNGMSNADYETKAAKLSYEIDSDWGLVKANLYKNFLDWKIIGAAGTNDLDNEVLVAQLENTIELNPEHTVRVQGEYRENQLETSLAAPGAEISYEVYALGGMWNWKINDELSWTNAARVDRLSLDHNGVFTAGSSYTASDFDQTVTEYSYNSGFVWKPSERDTFRLSTGRGLEIPSLIEYGLDVTSGPVYLGGNPRLDPAVVTNYELAWDRKIDSIDGLFRSAVFYNDTKDVKSLDGNATSATTFFSSNIGDSSSYGLELELNGKINESFDWGIGYTYQEIDDDLANGKTSTGLTTAKDYEESNPQHHINLSLGYKKDRWEVDTLFYYVSEADQYVVQPGSLGAYNFETIDDYIGANARVGYTFDNDVTLAVHGQQILSSETQTSVSPDIDRRVFVSLSKKF